MKVYEISLKQHTPIHIGKFQRGVVNETEIFIPGKTIWGAIVNFIIQKNEISSQEEIQKLQQKYQKITNFFPVFGEKEVIPTYNEKGKWGYIINGNFIDEEEFRFYLTTGEFKSTLIPLLRSTKEESLYEMESILPNGKIKDFVWEGKWKGYLILENDEDLEFSENDKIYIGGDVRYGLGLVEILEVKSSEDNKIFGNINLDGVNVKLSSRDNSPFFIKIDDNIKNKIEDLYGEIKIYPEFNFRENQKIVEDAMWVANIGSKINFGEELIFELDKGVLKFKNSNND